MISRVKDTARSNGELSCFGVVGHIEWGGELHLFAHELTHLAGGPLVDIGDGDHAVCFVRIVVTRGVVSTDDRVGGVPDVCLTLYCLVDRGIRCVLLVLSELAIEHHKVAYGNGARVSNSLAVNTIYAIGVKVLGRVGAFDLLDIEGCVAVLGYIVCMVGVDLFDITHDIILGASCGVSR